MSEEEKIRDAEHLKGLTDIVKNKTLFLIPFFSACLAFLLAKTDYIKEANLAIWALLAAVIHIRCVELALGCRELPDDLHLQQDGH